MCWQICLQHNELVLFSSGKLVKIQVKIPAMAQELFHQVSRS